MVRDLSDVCFYSYFSVMDDIRLRSPPDGQLYEIRFILHLIPYWNSGVHNFVELDSVVYLMGSIMVGLAGIVADFFGVSMTAFCKCPYMLFKGWQRLFHDLVGRAGPFLETACVPFAGLAIILWPAAVLGALIASMLSSFFLGGYAGIVTYQVCC